jgi:hypothetical protein
MLPLRRVIKSLVSLLLLVLAWSRYLDHEADALKLIKQRCIAAQTKKNFHLRLDESGHLLQNFFLSRRAVERAVRPLDQERNGALAYLRWLESGRHRSFWRRSLRQPWFPPKSHRGKPASEPLEFELSKERGWPLPKSEPLISSRA